MTRPMPGPPECTCMSRGNFCWTCVDTIGYDPEEECPSCPVHAVPTKRLTTYRKCSEPKRLTDVECAAEYWREQAEWWGGMHQKGPTAEGVDIRRAVIWERFATHPHALEES